jgi:hypothetical protein
MPSEHDVSRTHWMMPVFPAPLVRLTSPSGCPSFAMALKPTSAAVAAHVDPTPLQRSDSLTDSRGGDEHRYPAWFPQDLGSRVRLGNLAQDPGAELHFLVRVGIGDLGYGNISVFWLHAREGCALISSSPAEA